MTGASTTRRGRFDERRGGAGAGDEGEEEVADVPLAYEILEFLDSSFGRGLADKMRKMMTEYTVGGRFEKLVNRIPIVQGRIVSVTNLHDDQIITIEWDDGTIATVLPEEILRSAHEIHPL